MGGFTGPVPDEMWAALRREFGLPSLEQVYGRLSALPDVEPVLRSLVRVFRSSTTGPSAPASSSPPAASSIPG
ncbi:hypothetical protein [Arthrobacter sp. K5]|uniref:Uncharacterized protein n=1 Tax=Arthrobacter sp. K5 TaxID=2839623 RepID=A0AAU8EWH3_9MICC